MSNSGDDLVERVHDLIENGPKLTPDQRLRLATALGFDLRELRRLLAHVAECERSRA